MVRNTLLVLAALVATAAPASAQANGQAVNVMAYALDHPTDNAALTIQPQIGDSVPQSIRLRQVEGSSAFGYFYYQGQPIIVDLRTRAIVRVGQS